MRLGTLVYALAFTAATLSTTVEAGVPTDQLRGATDRVLKVLGHSSMEPVVLGLGTGEDPKIEQHAFHGSLLVATVSRRGPRQRPAEPVRHPS